MIYLTGVRNPAMDTFAGAGGERGPCPVGLLITPASAGLLATPGIQNLYAWVGLDNGCFSEAGRRACTPERFRATFDKCLSLWGDNLLYVAVPDVVHMTPKGPVGDWPATLAKFAEWAPVLRTWSEFVPLAIVLQDGATIESVPWSEVAAVFVGGSTDWKLGAEAEAICKHARRLGKWVHVGRVNSEKRMIRAAAMGADSADGTYLMYAAGEKAKKDPRAEAARVAGWAVAANDMLAREADPFEGLAEMMVAAGETDPWSDLVPMSGY